MKNRVTIAIGILATLFAIGGAIAFGLLKDFDHDGVSYWSGDCRPFDEDVSPHKTEISFDGVDQDCDGQDYIDSDTADNDGDGFTKLSGDCDDTDSTVHVGAPEIPDDIDNDCDGRVDEKIVTLDIISSPVIPSVGAKQGLVGQEFLREMSAVSIQSTGPIFDGYLNIQATTTSATAPNDGSKSVAIKMYIGRGNSTSFAPVDQRYLDAAWTGKGTNSLDTSHAGERGGVFFAGLLRDLRLNIRSIPVTAKSQWNAEKESINLIELLNKHENNLIIGFYTSAPGFGVINSATLELEVDEDTEVNLQKL